MKKTLLRMGVWAALALALHAHADQPYTWEDQTYRSRDEAWAAAKSRNNEAEQAIASGGLPVVNRSVLFVVPTAAALAAALQARASKNGKSYPAPGTPERAQADFFVEMSVQTWKSVVASLQKAKIYSYVSIQNTDSIDKKVRPSASQDVISVALNPDTGATIYFQTAKSDKQAVGIADSRTSAIDWRKKFIEDIRVNAAR